MTVAYDGTWFTLSLLQGPKPVRFHLLGKQDASGSYTVAGVSIVSIWNKNLRWNPAWAEFADRIHAGFVVGDRAETLRAIDDAEAADPAFVAAKRQAIVIYRDWAT